MPIMRVSREAQTLLDADPRLRIHSVFGSAVNVQVGDRLVTCTADVISAPHGVEMARADLARLQRLGRSAASATLEWRATQRAMVGGDGTVAAASAIPPEVFDPSVPAVTFTDVATQLGPLLEHLARARPMTGFGDQWSVLLDSDRMAHAASSLLAHTVDDGVVAWLGRGPGLTPSGDDVLVGMLAALWSAGALDARGAAAFNAALELAARRCTTVISVEYLHYASRGMAIGALGDLLSALGRSDPARAIGATERLGRFGHTSGMDCLLGAVGALRHLARSPVAAPSPDRLRK